MTLSQHLTRLIAFSMFVIHCPVAWAGPQDPLKKAELEKKKADTKEEFERRRAQMKADFEKRKAERKQSMPKPATREKPKSVTNAYDEKTKEFRCRDGKFTAYLPSQPQSKDLKVLGVTMKMFAAADRAGAYLVAYADLPIPSGESPQQTQERLDGARDGMIKNIGATLTGESKVQLQGVHPGREVTATIPNKAGVLRARIYLVGTRLYQVAAVGEAAWASSSEATKVLRSLSLIGE